MKKTGKKVDTMKQLVADLRKVALKPKKTPGSRNAGVSKSLPKSSYLSLLRNPFNREAYGCKVPDPMSKATSAYKLVGTVPVQSNTAGTGFGVVFKPNPLLTLIDAGHWSGITNTTYSLTAPTFTASAQNATFYSMTSAAGLASVVDNYRVVAFGVKMRMMIPQLSCTGRVIVCKLPRTKVDPTNIAINNQSYSYAVCAANGTGPTMVSPTVINSAALLELPGAEEFAMPDLIGRDLTFSSMPTSYAAFNFTNVATSGLVAVSVYQDEEVMAGATGGVLINASGPVDNTAGLEDICFYFDGLPSNQPLVEFEVIIHLEGVPAVANNAIAQPIPSTAAGSRQPLLPVDKIFEAVERYAPFLITEGAKLFESYVQRGQRTLTNG